MRKIIIQTNYVSLVWSRRGFPPAMKDWGVRYMLLYFSVEIIWLLQSQPQGLLERTSENICSPLRSASAGVVPFHGISSPQEPEVKAAHQTLLLLGSTCSLLINIQEERTEFDLESWVAFWFPLCAYRYCKANSLVVGRLHPLYFGEEC